jgi:hypothetical protein
VSNNWRFEHYLEKLQSLLHHSSALTFTHVKCEGNKLEDLLENKRVKDEISYIEYRLEDIPNCDLASQFSTLAQHDTPSLEAAV